MPKMCMTESLMLDAVLNGRQLVSSDGHQSKGMQGLRNSPWPGSIRPKTVLAIQELDGYYEGLCCTRCAASSGAD